MLILKQLGLDTFFDAISDGNSIQYSKPHPEVFMKAADLLNIPYKRMFSCRRCNFRMFCC